MHQPTHTHTCARTWSLADRHMQGKLVEPTSGGDPSAPRRHGQSQRHGPRRQHQRGQSFGEIGAFCHFRILRFYGIPTGSGILGAAFWASSFQKWLGELSASVLTRRLDISERVQVGLVIEIRRDQVSETSPAPQT